MTTASPDSPTVLQMRRPAGTFILLAALTAPCPLLAGEQGVSAEITLAPSVQAQILPHAAEMRPIRPLLKFEAGSEIERSFGHKSQGDLRFEVVYLENGLIGWTVNAVFRPRESHLSRHVLSLCGLVPLVVESSYKPPASRKDVPISELFLPLGIKPTDQYIFQTRIVSLASNARSICDPAPGSEFTFQYEHERVLSKSGNDGQGDATVSTAQVTTSKFVCKVGGSLEKPHPKLQGEILEVSCDIESGDGKMSSAKYAFLRESSYYLPLETRSNGERTQYQYIDFNYARP